jgi:hypothetical protein
MLVVEQVPVTTADPLDSAWDVVLVRTSRGDSESARPFFPLSKAQRDIMRAIDATSPLRELVRQRPDLSSDRLLRDAARLLAFGLVKQVHGEFPQQLVVEAMNLTSAIPVDAFPALVAARKEAAEEEERMARSRSTERWLMLLAALAAAVLGGAALLHR